MKPQNDNVDMQAQIIEDWHLVRRYSGRSLRVFVKVRGQDKYRANPLIDRLRGASERLKAAGVADVYLKDSPD